MSLEIAPIEGIPPVAQGDEVSDLLIEALGSYELENNDIVVVTHKIVSKAEGAVVVIEGDEEAFKRDIVESQSVSIIRRRGDLIIAETKHGFVCANAGVDRSNTAEGTMVLLPEDPDRSAHRIRVRLQNHYGVEVGVIVSDTFGRPFRRGLTDVAIGISGVAGVADLKGTVDWSGRELEVTEIAVADELAAAADLVMGKADGIPAAVIRGWKGPKADGKGRDLIRPVEEDLFR